jgi:hypothetical protein
MTTLKSNTSYDIKEFVHVQGNCNIFLYVDVADEFEPNYMFVILDPVVCFFDTFDPKHCLPLGAFHVQGPVIQPRAVEVVTKLSFEK